MSTDGADGGGESEKTVNAVVGDNGRRCVDYPRDFVAERESHKGTSCFQYTDVIQKSGRILLFREGYNSDDVCLWLGGMAIFFFFLS